MRVDEKNFEVGETYLHKLRIQKQFDARQSEIISRSSTVQSLLNLELDRLVGAVLARDDKLIGPVARSISHRRSSLIMLRCCNSSQTSNRTWKRTRKRNEQRFSIFM